MKGRDKEPAAVVTNAPDPGALCASCGRDLWWCGLPPDRDGDLWICAECDAARNFDVLEDL